MKKKTLLFYRSASFIKALFLALLLSVLKINAQEISTESMPTGFHVMADDLNHKIDIEFRSDSIIYDLIILVTDNIGHTIFLDNKRAFRGNYKHSVDLQMAEKGNYSVKILKDSERIEKKLTLK